MRSVWKNGVVHRRRQLGASDACSSLIVNDGIIEYLGDDPDAYISCLGETTSHCEAVDLRGRDVYPSFFDGHTHLLQFGSSLQKVGLDECKNLEQIRNTIATAARSLPTAQRILCRGWRQSSTGREALASMLDDIDPRPIYIDADDLHSVWCNSEALKEMGIDRNSPEPPSGTIHRSQDGDPTGLISEGAVMVLVWPHLIALMSRDERLNCLRTAIREYHTSGYVGAIEMAMDKGAWELLEYLHKNEDLDFRIAAHWFIYPMGDDEKNLAQVQEAIDIHAQYNLETSPNFRIAGIKLVCDGVVDSCTAALSQPYLVAPNGHGELLWTPDALQKVVAKADEAHLQIALHAIGEAAIKLAINALGALGTTGRRHRIEHLELTHPDDAKKLGKLGITASVQPVHSDPSILGAWPELIGSERCEWAFAYQDFHQHGAQLAIGTDAPTAPHWPLPNLHVASTRLSAREPTSQHKINQRPPLDLYDAWSAATWGAAYSCFSEQITGSLEVGKRADFIVIEQLQEMEGSLSLLDGYVAETWMDGRQLYKR